MTFPHRFDINPRDWKPTDFEQVIGWKPSVQPTNRATVSFFFGLINQSHFFKTKRQRRCEKDEFKMRQRDLRWCIWLCEDTCWTQSQNKSTKIIRFCWLFFFKSFYLTPNNSISLELESFLSNFFPYTAPGECANLGTNKLLAFSILPIFGFDTFTRGQGRQIRTWQSHFWWDPLQVASNC